MPTLQRSASGLAAGDVQCSTCDVACSVGYEVCYEITDFVELSVTADRDDLGVISGEFLGLNASCVSERLVVSRCAKSGCLHDAGRYSDDADVVLAEFLCPAAGAAVNHALARGG